MIRTKIYITLSRLACSPPGSGDTVCAVTLPRVPRTLAYLAICSLPPSVSPLAEQFKIQSKSGSQTALTVTDSSPVRCEEDGDISPPASPARSLSPLVLTCNSYPGDAQLLANTKPPS